MSVRERFKSFKSRIREGSRRAPQPENSPSLSTCPLPEAQTALASTSPSHDLLAVPTTSQALPRLASAPPSGSPTGPSSWKYLKGFEQVLAKSSGVLGPLKTVIDDLAQCVATHEDVLAARQDYAALQTELEAVFNDMSHHFSENVPPGLTVILNNICGAIERELDRIASKEERKAWKAHFEAKKDLDEVMKCYRRIHGHLERLNLNSNINTWKTVDDLATEARLSALKPSMPARYNSAQASEIGRRDCTPKTRENVLMDLSHWRHDQQQGNIFWLNGMAGTGKTTIANTLCVMLDRSHELGASFFCTRLLPECRDAKRILPSIAYQLARFSRPFRFALSRTLEADPDLHTLALPTQLQGLIIGPLRDVSHTLPNDVVIVIDALDECEDSTSVAQILELLANHASDLPLKIFVSSRPEPQIRDHIGNMKPQLILHELDDKVVKDDIETYLRNELAVISLSESQLATLVESAGVLFIYAATVARYIRSETSHVAREKRLESVLSASAPASSIRNKNIDVLYSTILDSAFNNPDLEDEDRERMKLVLDTVICAQEPLTVDALSGLLQLGPAEWVNVALRPLWSVLHISNNFVTTLHASFPDYMLESKRSDKHACDRMTHHGRLAELCFQRIERNERQFNICGLESSYLCDDQVPNLGERVKESIPLELGYACQYWALHLELGRKSEKRVQQLENFLYKRLLLWMEILNLTERISIGIGLLQKARKWCTDEYSSPVTESLIHDAWRFVTMVATNHVSRSTPHIYLSMLAFWPRSTLLTDCYIKRTTGLVDTEGTGMTRRQLALLGVYAVGCAIYSVAFSPDGLHAAFGSDHNGIYVWDVQNGRNVLGPLNGHTQWVNTLAFSPNSTYIASGSYDKTICVWNSQSGKMVLRPLEGHTSEVLSVAFSPDGTCIASGSSDKTIRVWDAQSGEMVLGPLNGHMQYVSSVAYSPDGMRIVSGSLDSAIRVWDAQSGKMVLGPLQGHTRCVNLVAFSPDGMHIISASDDHTIRLWDSVRGTLSPSSPKGYAGPVTSVAFSPNGMRIVSGSSDCKIRMWDAQSGRLILGPLEGHTGVVNSVAFSPDGLRIVSGSWDNTIRVWDPQTQRVVPGPLEGHTYSVNSAVFSHDGARIVSGSADHRVGVWDVPSGTSAQSSFEGRTFEGWTKAVLSVMFSPDDTRIISGALDEAIRVWDVQSGKMVLGAPGGNTREVRSVAFSLDGMRMVSAGLWDKTILVWDVQSRKIVLGPLEGHTHYVQSVAFSPDGMYFASGSSDKTIRVWDAQSGKIVIGPLEGHTEGVHSVVFSPDGTRIATGSFDKAIRMWDVQSGTMVLGPLEGHTDCVNSVAFSPDGMRIVSGSADNTICIWDTQNGQIVLGPFHGHTRAIQSTSFSPDGTCIVSGSVDCTIRIWRLPKQPYIPIPDSCSLDALSSRVPSDSTISQPCLLDRPGCPPLPWTLDENGWVVDGYKRLCLWVPPDLHTSLLRPNNTHLISRHGSVRLRFEGAHIGESWTECYSPYPPE